MPAVPVPPAVAGLDTALAGLDLGFDGAWPLWLAGLLAGWALLWTAPAGLAAAVAGAMVARRRVAGWCAGWCAGAAVAGGLVVAVQGAGVSGWALGALAYAPVWAASAALVAVRGRRAP